MVAPSTLIETHGFGMGSKASIHLRIFIFLFACSIVFALILKLKDREEPPAYPHGFLRIQAIFRNEYANRFFNLNYIITLI